MGATGLAAWLSETPVAFACLCVCGIETAIAFAGEKWAFLVSSPGFCGGLFRPLSFVLLCVCFLLVAV